ncbi:lantibiotic immunity ABC transporter MutE/EpiE family permease subunit [Ktedonobacter racemifer]|uniref:Putative lantibiotic ABC transporter, permease protein n=1 Tax=Ktedonobacter racemifer DSM 44963 TaxID=485913 RepID=D6TCV7_KTERA|nr:lantibiotic immunity ABC transporter MutE/EpiE family permease subunit [Ktedonobacter racemifer]EFH88221.1 putative lantibiotic ABC transporter, permease protein [Ktedonobacter racemifer DSM 44963]
MFNILRAEWLRLKRTFTPIFLAVLPVSLVALEALLRFLTPNARAWSFYLWSILNWWPLIWLPFGIALLASHSMEVEKRARAWKALRARAVAPEHLYLGKLLVLTIHTLVSSLLLIVSTLLVGVIALQGEVPWLLVCKASFMLWMAALPLISLMLWFAYMGGYILAIVANLLGFFAGAVAGLSNYWLLVPWAVPLRMAVPIVGVLPNGIPLQAHDPLWQMPVLPIVGVALVGYVLFAIVGAFWFVRKEVK